MHRPVTYTSALRILHTPHFDHAHNQIVSNNHQTDYVNNNNNGTTTIYTQVPGNHHTECSSSSSNTASSSKRSGVLLEWRRRAVQGKMWLTRLTRRLTKVQLLLGLGLGVAIVVLMKQMNDSSQLDGADQEAAVYRQMGLKSNYQYDGDNAGGAGGVPAGAPADYVFYNKEVPLVWVGGVPRSGTTLARAMLDAHPDIRCGEETRVIPRILGMHAQMMKSPLETMRLKEAKITEEVLNDALGAYILSIISKHGELARRLCNKDPFALRSMAKIAKIFPRSKFILMVRDGRATIHSIISRKVTIKGFDSHSYRGAIQDWNRAIENMYNQCETVGEKLCLPVHYENLVLHPEREMRRVLAFLGMPWNEVVLHHEKTIGQAGGVSLSKKELSTDQVNKPVNTAALTKWVGHIPPDVRQDMEQLAPMLRRLGYDPNGYPPDYGTADKTVEKHTAELELVAKLEKAQAQQPAPIQQGDQLQQPQQQAEAPVVMQQQQQQPQLQPGARR